MTTPSSRSLRSLVLAALPLALAFPACQPEAAPTATEAARPAALRVEEAAHGIEMGKDLEKNRAALEAVRNDATLTSREREDVALSLADVHDLAGDRDGAVTILEDFLADQNQRASRDGSTDRAQKRLRALVGLPEQVRRDRSGDRTYPFAPVTRALASYFPRDGGKGAVVQSLIIGGTRDVEARLGTWNLAGAIEAAAAEACSLCDLPSLHYRSSHDGSFLGLVRERDLVKTALVAIYYDREEGLVPVRYESLLALPLADLNARLDRGEGVIAVKERVGAPPLVLLAAPRRAQLAAVDEAFAALTKLPSEAVSVNVSPALLASEIQATVRGARSGFKACYESYLTSSPGAAGKIMLDFAITPGGRVENEKVTGTGSVADAVLLGCFTTELRKLSFPSTKTSGSTTVRYPLDLAP